MSTAILTLDYWVKRKWAASWKNNKMTVRPAKTQISLDIRPFWSESSLCAHWVTKDPSFLHADSKESDQTMRMPRLIWVFAGAWSFCWFCHVVAQILKWNLIGPTKAENISRQPALSQGESQGNNSNHQSYFWFQKIIIHVHVIIIMMISNRSDSNSRQFYFDSVNEYMYV